MGYSKYIGLQSQTQLKQLSTHMHNLYGRKERRKKRIINYTRYLRLLSITVQWYHGPVISCITLLARIQGELKHIGPYYLKHHHAPRRRRELNIIC